MDEIRIVSETSIRIKTASVPGALERQQNIPGFDQEALSQSRILCIGAGGIIGHIAPSLARKGVGTIIVVDDDVVEPSNLNRQFFYPEDIGRNKALALCKNLRAQCTYSSSLIGYAARFEEAVAAAVDLRCDLGVCGVDNNPTRVAASAYFRQRQIPIVFAAVSADADHGYTFVQDREGPCFGCVFPDAVDSQTYPCPGTPAIADILQLVGALAVYAADGCLMKRPRSWNYRQIFLSSGPSDGAKQLQPRPECRLCGGVGRSQ